VDQLSVVAGWTGFLLLGVTLLVVVGTVAVVVALVVSSRRRPGAQGYDDRYPREGGPSDA
jgi:hypothetical protein